MQVGDKVITTRESTLYLSVDERRVILKGTEGVIREVVQRSRVDAPTKTITYYIVKLIDFDEIVPFMDIEEMPVDLQVIS